MHNDNDLAHAIGNPPGWGMRWGLWVVLGALALLVSAAALISYSDVVEAPAVLTMRQPPFRVSTPTPRTVATLLVTDGTPVKQGQPLLMWQSGARLEDVEVLEKALNANTGLQQLARVFAGWNRHLQTGSIGPAFAAVRRAAQQLLNQQQDAHYQGRLHNLRKQVAEQQALARSLQQQLATLQQEVQLAADNVQRDSILLARHSLSGSEYDLTLGNFLRKKRELENLQAEQVRNRLMGQQLEAALLALQAQQTDAANAAKLELESALLQLRSAIEDWKSQYLLPAPLSGRVELPQERHNGQVIAAGEVIMRIVPADDNEAAIVCRAYLPASAIARIKPGMEGRLRLEAYPWQQHGEVEAQVQKIAAVPEKGSYEATLALSNGLKSTQGQELEFHHEMTGTVRITTNRRSLLRRLFEKLR